MTNYMKPYSQVADSGTAWLGLVPAHWKVMPGRACFLEKKEPNVGLRETTVLSLSYGKIVVKPPQKLHGLVPTSFETYQIIDPLDVVVRPTDLQNDKHSLRFGISRDRGIITSAYLCFVATERLIPQYCHLLLHSYDLKKVFYGLGSGLRQNLDWTDFKHLPCAVPPLPEQTAIARFLDHMGRRIQRYIRAKERLIELLDEYKQALIHQAVTGQIDVRTGRAYSAYKPSGIEWLSGVPSHWDVRPAKWHFTEVDERSVMGSEELLSVSHITGVTPRSEKSVTMFRAESNVGHKVCRRGDLVVNTMWAWMAALGVAPREGIVSPSYAVYRAKPGSALVSDYAEMLLRSRPYRYEYATRSTGIRSSRLRLYPDVFLSIKLACPPDGEQRAIIDFVEREAANIDRAIVVLRRGTVQLRAFQERLVADVVTGKLDVREAAASLPDSDVLEATSRFDDP